MALIGIADIKRNLRDWLTCQQQASCCDDAALIAVREGGNPDCLAETTRKMEDADPGYGRERAQPKAVGEVGVDVASSARNGIAGYAGVTRRLFHLVGEQDPSQIGERAFLFQSPRVVATQQGVRISNDGVRPIASQYRRVKPRRVQALGDVGTYRFVGNVRDAIA